MTATLSRFEMVRAALRQGIPKHLAEKLAGEGAIPDVTLPLTLTLPWSCLVSDNERSTIGGGSRPRLVNGARYRVAKRRIAEIAREAVGDVRPVTGPVALHAKIYVPDNRVHDTGNLVRHMLQFQRTLLLVTIVLLCLLIVLLSLPLLHRA